MRGTKARIAAAAIVVLALAAAAKAEVFQSGNVRIEVSGMISPSRLPQKQLAPTSLELSSTIGTTDRSHVPRTETITVESNAHGRIDTSGVPTCNPKSLTNTVTSQAKQICGKALIGTGSAKAEILFPEQAPFGASGPMLIFNGTPRHGHPVFVIHVYSHVPAPTTFVTTGEVEQRPGKGAKMTFRIPTIVGGQGSLTGFTATLRRVIRASCPAPAGLPGAVFPFAKSTFVLQDGRTVHTVLVRECKVRR